MFSATYPDMDCYTVSQLGLMARSVLNEAFGGETWVTGEIHGYKMHDKSGHVYFDLVEKDAMDPGKYVAKIGCAFFKNSFLSWRTRLRREGSSSFQLADGMEVKLRADVDLYVKEGRYQLIVSEIDADYSLGAMARKRRQTIEDLKKSGLFEKNRALAITDCPLNIGLITSVNSAAYNDFVSVLNSSGYSFRLSVFDAYMQGGQTPIDVVRGINALERRDLDVIAIVRGGGAKTDLFYFDDIRICEAIARCRLPVLTGIGHEIDLSVADMVANRNFVTPTDTARFLKSALDDFRQRITDARVTLETSALSFLAAQGEVLRMLTYRASIAVSAATEEARAYLRSSVRELYTSASRISALDSNRLAALTRLIDPAARTIIRTAGLRLDGHENLIKAMDPASTLMRGFSITMGPGGIPLTDADDIETGARLRTVLYKGGLTSIVESKETL